jgi:hypothetical protein
VCCTGSGGVAHIPPGGLRERGDPSLDRLLLGTNGERGHPPALQAEDPPVTNHSSRNPKGLIRRHLSGGLLQYDASQIALLGDFGCLRFRRRATRPCFGLGCLGPASLLPCGSPVVVQAVQICLTGSHQSIDRSPFRLWSEVHVAPGTVERLAHCLASNAMPELVSEDLGDL